MLEYEIFGELVYLMLQRSVFLPANNMLMLADIHLGKATHFRKAGIGVPSHIPLTDLSRLSEAIRLVPDVQEVCFLGDLFHSHANQEWGLFEDWMGQYPHLRFSLVLGNHDVHGLSTLPKGLEATPRMQVGPFLLTHEPEQGEGFNFCGHVHPSVIFHGQGRQTLQLPCFYFTEQRCILPAFGNFNSHASLPLQKAKAVFAVGDSKVWRMR